MKIAFVTSSLEPGRDGVGDYTTLLAGECACQGHTVVRLALHERMLAQPIRESGLLRLPAGQGWPERVNEARRWLQEFSPDWVSLQFVSYGFESRGLAGRIAPHLRAILAGWPVHVFMHELWLGDETDASWKDRIIGWMQRGGILSMLRSLTVRRIHASNDAYVQLLRQRGLAAERLPLFGSLPLPDPTPGPPCDHLALIMFGTLHPVWPPEPLFTRLREVEQPLTISHVGHIGTGRQLWEKLAQEYRGSFTFHLLGAKSPQTIANLFATSHFGIATTPWVLIGKSASTAAMLDAGLPVIVNRDDVHYSTMPHTEADPLLLRMAEDLPGQLMAAHRQPPRLHLPSIAERFLAELTDTNHHG